MQTFRPAEVDLESTGAGHDLGGDGTGAPGAVARTSRRLEAADGGLISGVWECSAGTKEYVFSTDEWAYVLEGEAHVTADGATHVLRPGDVFYTPAGMQMTWVVPEHVRKVWVHRRPPLRGRVVLKLRRLLARVRGAAALGVGALAAKPYELVELAPFFG
jgi:uncharacterized cupin superfamily protein